jgi:hypothetical protein
MITVAEYDRIQVLLGRIGRPRAKRHVFAYTGLMKCGSCGGSITASEKQKILRTTGQSKTYVFYHCSHRRKKGKTCLDRYCVPVNDLEKLILDELTKYQIRPTFKDWALTFARENFQNEYSKNEILISAQVTHENAILKQLNNLIDLRLSDGINESTYVQKKAEKEEELLRVRSRKKDLEEEVRNWIKEMEDRLNFTTDIVKRFTNADSLIKKEICHDIGSNWVLKDKKLFIDKAEWLEPIRKYKEGVEDVLEGFEPEKTFENKEQNIPSTLLRPLLRGLVDDVRTIIVRKRKESAK